MCTTCNDSYGDHNKHSQLEKKNMDTSQRSCICRYDEIHWIDVLETFYPGNGGNFLVRSWFGSLRGTTLPLFSISPAPSSGRCFSTFTLLISPFLTWGGPRDSYIHIEPLLIVFFRRVFIQNINVLKEYLKYLSMFHFKKQKSFKNKLSQKHW